MKKLLRIFLCVLAVILCATASLAHSGRTDSRGGHKDNNNVSGLGRYHYHCGGNPPHLHENGVCPYATVKKETTAIANTKVSETTQKSKKSVIPYVFFGSVCAGSVALIVTPIVKNHRKKKNDNEKDQP